MKSHFNTSEKNQKAILLEKCAYATFVLILSVIHCMSFSRMNNAGQMQPGQVPSNQNFLNRPPGPIPVTHGNVQQQVNQQCFFPSLLSPALLSLSVSLALCTHPVCISPRPEMECACCSKPSSSPPLCPSLSASVCGGGLALRQSGHTDGGPAETKQHGENQKHNYTRMHAHRQDHDSCKHRISPLYFLPFQHQSCEQRHVLKGTLLKQVTYAQQGSIYLIKNTVM